FVDREIERARVADSFCGRTVHISVRNDNLFRRPKTTTKRLRCLFCDRCRSEVQHTHNRTTRLRLRSTPSQREQINDAQDPSTTPALFVLLYGYHDDRARRLRSLFLPGNRLDGVRTRAVVPSRHYSPD